MTKSVNTRGNITKKQIKEQEIVVRECINGTFYKKIYKRK